MQSGKQKRAAIMQKRRERGATLKKLARLTPAHLPIGGVLAKPAIVAANSGSFSAQDFVRRGYYLDLAFTCRDCGARQVWTAEQQQWWYETAKGCIYSTAIRCASCRQQRRLALSGNQNKKEAK